MKVKLRRQIISILSDYISVIVGIFLFNIYRYWKIFSQTSLTFSAWNYDPNVIASFIIFPLMMIALYGITGYYFQPFGKSRYEVVSNTVIGAVVGTLLIYFAIMVNDNFVQRLFHYGILLALVISLSLPVLVQRVLLVAAFRRTMLRGVDTYNVLVVGHEPYAKQLAEKIKVSNSKFGYRVVGVVDPDRPDLHQLVQQLNVKAFVAASDFDNPAKAVEILNKLYPYNITILVPLSLFSLLTSRPRLSNITGQPLIDITATGLSHTASNIKRISDFIIATCSIIILLPVYLVVAVLIKLDSKGSIIYSQERVGIHRKKFKIYKFRTMIVDSEPHGPELSSADDVRVTKIGHFLRKYRLDEIPQFWNVIRGDMSLVGPRPEREYFLNQLIERIPAVYCIYNVRPGLTSLGTVKYGYASNIEQMVQRVYFDLLYLESMSFAMDFKVMFHTVNTVLTGKGV